MSSLFCAYSSSSRYSLQGRKGQEVIPAIYLQHPFWNTTSLQTGFILPV